MLNLRDVRQAKVANRRVLVRIDLNFETDKRGRIRDLTRINSIKPTIEWLRQNRAKIILLSHRGRPTKPDPAETLKPAVKPLRRLFKKPIAWWPDARITTELIRATKTLRPGGILLIENLRFNPGEQVGSTSFAKQLAKLGDVYVNEAFAVSHRADASVASLPKLLPAFAGFQLQTEIKELSSLLTRPIKPYVAVLGGAKISTKLHLVKSLLRRADHVLLGGALANTLLQAEGLAIGQSLTEPKMLNQIRGLTVRNKHLHIPCDVMVVRGALKTGQRGYVRAVGAVKPNERIVDIGPDTVELYGSILKKAATVVWNGPMGVYEQPPFDRGTKLIAKVIGRGRNNSVVGGGETVDAVKSQKLTAGFSFISTGGGAMLEFLEGKTLPGLKPLMK